MARPYEMYSNTMASVVKLTPDALYFKHLEREMSESTTDGETGNIVPDLQVRVKKGERGWNTEEPIY